MFTEFGQAIKRSVKFPSFDAVVGTVVIGTGVMGVLLFGNELLFLRFTKAEMEEMRADLKAQGARTDTLMTSWVEETRRNIETTRKADEKFYESRRKADEKFYESRREADEKFFCLLEEVRAMKREQNKKWW